MFFQSFRMEQRGKKIPRRAFQCLVFLLGIFRIRGSAPNPQTMIPQSPKGYAPTNHASALFLPSSPPTFAAKEHTMPGSAIPPQRSQVLKTYHNLCHDLAPSIVIAPSTLVRCGSPVGEVQGKPSNGAPLTLPHAAAPSPSVFPLIPHDVPPTVPRIAPSTVHMPGAKTFNGSMMPPIIAPTNNSHFNDLFPILSPIPRDSNNTRTLPVSHPLPPEGRITQSPQPAGNFSVPGHKDGKIEGIPASAPLSVSPSPAISGSLHSPPPLHQHVRIPKYKRDPILKHVVSPAPLPYFGSPVVSPAPVNHSPFKVPKNARRNIAPWHNAEGPEANPTRLPRPSTLNNKKKPYAPSPGAEGSFVNHAPMHPHIEISKKPYFPPDQAPSSGKSATPVSLPATPHTHNRWPIYHPAPSPSYFRRRSQPPEPQPILLLPPPPPNLRCGPIMCQEPLVNPLPGSPCTCVMPIKVGLRLSVALYTFFPLVSKFAQEIASGIFVKQSQVRIMGANAASEDTEKTIVLIDLVPLGRYFDKTTLFLSYEKFWHKQVKIQPSSFGDYDVLYVLYPGLPPSPPIPPAYIISDGRGYGSDNNARGVRPLGVDVRKQKRKVKLSGSLITIIFLSAVILLVLIFGAVWFLLSRNWKHSNLPASRSQSLQTPSKFAAARAAPIPTGTTPNSASISFSSSIATYTGSTKGFSLADIENMTNKFDDLRIIGEGGFGRVYEGTLEDGMKVAVKVLKRDDKQGEREFLAEVEMLGRLHHRNLVKLIGICAEENTRCLIYELIPNGSVELHLHGADKDISPLDWNERMKIALGAARGLAYLHEDSSPPVIHRDFKSSNILLEHDNTPKVSDFGLARVALDKQNEHISTRVMGTFGYVAPEYAMTGHLLVKSDVYSYGVVLLELLTGRKPVDMLQPPGQENLVSWARPLLTKPEGLAMIIDPTLGVLYPRDSAAKVAAIASMCVEPEVSHRPFMGEVVQALKLVCDESNECRHSGSCSNDGSSTKDCPDNTGMLYAVSAAHAGGDASGLFGMHSGSGPLRTGRSRHFWQRFRGLASGSESEHWATHRFRSRSEHRRP